MRGTFVPLTVIFSFSVLPKSEAVNAGDLEQKSLADEREAYEGTPSEETRIEQKLNKNEEIRRISTLILLLLEKYRKGTMQNIVPFVFLFGYA